jgi:ADP-heptose:LPS heptosyltransferase
LLLLRITGSGGVEKIGDALTTFRRLKAADELTAEITGSLSTQASTVFWEHYLATGSYLREAIVLLCEIATLEDEQLSKPGLTGLFPLLVERLNDSFNPELCSLYDQVFVQVITFCRSLPAGRALDSQLRQFGLSHESALLVRKARLKKSQGIFAPSLRQEVKKVFVLSRVTLGAEIAITSIILSKLKQVFQQAELLLIADPRMEQLFGGDPRIRVCPIQYERSGGLIERLNSWLEVVKLINQERVGLKLEEILVIDPDSRLTQLGILPVVEDDSRYLFFESRGYRKPGINTIGQLTADWLNERFGSGPQTELYPYVSLHMEDKNLAKKLCQKLRATGDRYLVSISFGIGGNVCKRVPDPFEKNLLLRLLADGCTIILDKGIGEERVRANQLIRELRQAGKKVFEINETNFSEVLQLKAIECHIITWEGGIGPFSALIAESNEYIGYDSAGQHIAAALRVPTIDIFADTRYPLFFERWKPYSKSPVMVIRVDPSHPMAPSDIPNTILSQVMSCHHTLKARNVHTRVQLGTDHFFEG